jgi:Tol biopolymer transport system component
MVLTLTGAHHVEPLVRTPATERNGVVSPDGRWLAYESDSSGEFEIYIKPFPNVSDGIWQISTGGGKRPLWSRKNGEELFWVAPDGAIMAVRVDARGATWSAGSPSKSLEGPYATGDPLSARNYDVSNDGQRFLMVKQPTNPDAAAKIIVVQNWFEELQRLVPTK